MSCFPRLLVVILAALATAASARAQEAAPAPAPGPKGPRLVYTRGPDECLTEEKFRREVAIANDDGADHFDATAPDVLRVWFEKLSASSYRGTLEYTDAEGQKEPPDAQIYYNCEILGRFVGGSASYYIPQNLPLAAPPAPVPPSAPPPAPPGGAPAAGPNCPACGTWPPALPALPKPSSWRRMDLTVGIRTYVMMTSFLTANVEPAVGLGADIGGDIITVSFELRAALPGRAYARERIPGATSSYPVEFDLSQFTVLLVPCARWKYLVGCAVGQVGMFNMKTTASESDQAAFGLGPRVGFEVPFAERFGVFGFGEVLFSPSPGGFVFDLPPPGQPDGPLANTRWVQPVASAFFGAGFSMKFR